MSSVNPSGSRHGLAVHRLVLWLALVAAAGSQAAVSGTFATIGPTPDCLYNSALDDAIQTALDEGQTELRLLGGVEYLGSVLHGVDADIAINGGYASCASAALGELPEQPEASIIRPLAADGFVLWFHRNAGARLSVELSHLQLSPVEAESPPANGLVIAGLLSVALRDSRIEGFDSSSNGGGALVSEANLSLYSSHIVGNSARNGGGVYCSEGGSFRMDGRSAISGNHAIGTGDQGNGGGLFADHCTIHSEGRLFAGDEPGPQAGITLNIADNRGGGVFADASFLSFKGGRFCSMSAPEECGGGQALLGLNQSAGRGGGIALTNGAEAEFDMALVSGNRAGDMGAGIYAEDGSNVRFGGLLSLYPQADRSECVSAPFCDEISRNRMVPEYDEMADSPSSGAGVALIDSSFGAGEALMFQNQAHATQAILALGTSTLVLRQLVLADLLPMDWEWNEDFGRNYIHVAESSTASIRQSTLFGNSDGYVVFASPASTVSIDGSAIINPRVGPSSGGSLYVEPGAVISGDCNASMGLWFSNPIIPNMDVSLDAFDGILPAADGNLVDQCDPSSYGGTSTDAAGRERFVDRAGSPFPLDIGALELSGDRIFADAFEASTP